MTVPTILYQCYCSFQKFLKKPYVLKISLPPATKVGPGNVFTGVCDSVNGGGLAQGGCLLPGGLLLGGLVWGVSTPVGAGLVWGGGCLLRGVPGGDPTPLGWPLLWAVRILLECILVYILNFTAKAIYNGLKYPRTIC